MKYFFISVAIGAFLLLLLSLRNPYPVSKSDSLVGKVLSESSKQIKEKYNLIPVGTGIAAPGGPIRKLCLSFFTKNELTRDQIRIILIDSANIIVDVVNKNQEIQSHLFSPPFTIANVQVIIFNHDEKGYKIYHPEISVAEISNLKLTFDTVEESNKFDYKDHYEETYEEALQLLENKN